MTAGILLAMLAGGGVARAGTFENRWFYLSGSPFASNAVEEVGQLVRTAGEAGLNGMLWSCGFDDCDRWTDRQKARILEIKAICDRSGVEIIPLVWSVGYGTMLGRDPNLVAAQPVEDMPYVADAAGERAVWSDSATPLLPNGDFEETGPKLLPHWHFWDQEGVVTFRDTEIRHGGAASVRLEPSYGKNPHGHARICYACDLKPRHLYRLSVWIRTEGLAVREGQPGLSVLAHLCTAHGERPVSVSPKLASTQDWTRVELPFASGEATAARFYVGTWGGAGGRVWVDDVALSEPGLPLFLQRAGTPVTVRDAASGRVYRAGKDYELPPVRSLRHAQDAEAAAIRLVKGGAIKSGARLLVSAYAPSVTASQQLSTCMSEPALYRYFDRSARAIQDLIRPRKWFLSMDEIRSGGTCAACEKRGVDMAHQLADCLKRQRASILRASPGADIYVWSDMLDPAHNAHDNYYACKGTFAGVWDLIPKDLIVSCWYYEKRDVSLPFFAARGFRTLGAAYYDADTLDTSRDWLDSCRRTKGCTGIMYTTWRKKYALLKPFGEMLRECPDVTPPRSW